MKNIFERAGGSLAGPGSVSFNFEHKGLITIKKSEKPDEQMLELIDSGAEDIEDGPEYLEVYVAPEKLSQMKDIFAAKNFEIESFSLAQKPKTFVTLPDVNQTSKVLKLLESFDDHDDVQNVFSNLDIPDEVAKQLN
jgi:transcriptional/translational regulatory protein YebC/TACO1